MAHYETLSRPPIVEAIFQIDVAPSEDFDFSTVFQSKDCLEGEWKKKMAYTGQVEFKAEEKLQISDRKLEGFVVYIPDSKRPSEVYELEPKKLAFHKLPGYSDFGACLDTLSKFWETYRGLTSPKRALGISARFVNQIRIPLQGFDFSDYFSIPLPVSPEWPSPVESISNYRSVMNFKISDVSYRVLLMTQASSEPSMLNFVFDITVKTPILNESPTREFLHQSFSPLRAAKNQIFFGALTEKAVSLFR